MPVLRVVAGLFGLVGWFAFLGLQRAWRRTFGWLFRTLADLLDGIELNAKFIHWRPFGGVASWLRSLDRNVWVQLGTLALESEHLAVWLFSRLRLMFAWIGREVEGLAGDLLAFAVRLVKVTIPRLVGRLLRAVWRELKAQGRAFLQLLTGLRRQLLRLGRTMLRNVVKNARDLLRFSRWTFGTVRRHWKAIRGVLAMLKRVSDKLLPRQFNNLFARTLHALGVPWILATNVKRVGTWVMHLDVGDVYEFVKDEMPSFDFCKLAGFQYDFAVHVVEPIMQRVVASQDWYCTLPGDTLPSAVTAHPGYLGSWEPTATEALYSPVVSRRLAPDVPLPRGEINA